MGQVQYVPTPSLGRQRRCCNTVVYSNVRIVLPTVRTRTRHHNNTVVRSAVRIVLPTIRTRARRHNNTTIQQYNSFQCPNCPADGPYNRQYRTFNIARIDSVFQISQDERRTTFRSSLLRNSIVNRLELSNFPQEHS